MPPTLTEVLDFRILDRLRDLSEGDATGMFPFLVSSFLEQSAEKIGELSKLAALRDFPALARAAHGLKGLSMNFGALGMSRNSDTLQTAAEAGEGPMVLETMVHLRNALAGTRVALAGLPGLEGTVGQ